LLTCISHLLLAECLEGQVLEAGHLGLEEAQVHERGTGVVVPRHVVHVRTDDVEEGQPSAVHTAYLDPGQLTTASKPIRGEEEVLGLEHVRTLLSAGAARRVHVSLLGGEAVS
jgi:hypothetical protein